jgi:hypothetical protein
MLRFTDAAFGGSHVRLAHLCQAIDTVHALLLVVHGVTGIY